MSLVSTFVQSQEGNWYKNPIVKGDGWFICWDDDEPIELVMKKGMGLQIPTILAELKKQGWELAPGGHVQKNAQRIFDDDEFHPAMSVFLKQKRLGPTEKMLEGNERMAKKPEGDGVYYSSTPNGNGGRA
jgi:hypothetical protein